MGNADAASQSLIPLRTLFSQIDIRRSNRSLPGVVRLLLPYPARVDQVHRRALMPVFYMNHSVIFERIGQGNLQILLARRTRRQDQFSTV
jgi:hypothetical protein